MNILSLCDGLSCGRMALEKAGIKVDRYYASEIKDIAIKATKHNFPDTIFIGDVNKITYSDGILHTENGDFKEQFDLVIYGSPCQSCSRAMPTATRTGLKDTVKSGLFFECNRIMKEVNPKYFLMENVVMKKEDENTITELMGVNPVRINSRIITAQMRDRLYWTNIPFNEIKPKEVKVSDILKDGYYPYDKARCLMKNDSHGYYNGCGWCPSKRFYRWYHKAFTTMIFENEKSFLDCVDRFNEIIKDKDKISAALFNEESGECFKKARYLWKEERARLQTIPEKYVEHLTEFEAADLIGDGWTVDIIAHIFKGLMEPEKKYDRPYQPSLFDVLGNEEYKQVCQNQETVCTK